MRGSPQRRKPCFFCFCSALQEKPEVSEAHSLQPTQGVGLGTEVTFLGARSSPLSCAARNPFSLTAVSGVTRVKNCKIALNTWSTESICNECRSGEKRDETYRKLAGISLDTHPGR
jgi:hypothetical protein